MRTTLVFLAVIFTQVPFSLICYAQNAEIRGNLTGLKDGSYIYLTSCPLGDSTVSRYSTTLRSGYFQFQMNIPSGQGNIYYLSTIPLQFSGDDPLNFFARSRYIKLIYLEKGQVIVNGNGLNLDEVTLSGDSFAREENDYYSFLHSGIFLPERWKKQNDSLKNAPGKSGDLDTAAVIFMASWLFRREASIQWVLIHQNSSFSPVVLWKFVGNDIMSEDLQSRDSILHLIIPEARNNKVARYLESWWDAEFWIPKKLRIGMKAPDFNISRPGQSSISLNSYKGQYLVIIFKEFPYGGLIENFQIDSLLKKYKGKRVQILQIDIISKYIKSNEQIIIKPDRNQFRYANSTHPGVDAMSKDYDGSKVQFSVSIMDPTGIIVSHPVFSNEIEEFFQLVLP